VTVQCPRCATQYRVPDSRLTDAHPVFKCTRCNLVFSRDADRTARSSSRGREDTVDKNLRFDFDREPTGPELEEEELADEIAAPDEPTARGRTSGTGSAARTPAPETKPALRSIPPVAKPEPRPEPKPAQRSRRLEPEMPADDDDFSSGEPDAATEGDEAPVLIGAASSRSRAPIRPRGKSAAAGSRGSPIRPIGVAVGVILAAYLVLAMLLNARADVALDSLSRIPLLGRLLQDDNLLVVRLQLADVESGFDRLKGDRRAYVVSGRAINTSNQSVRLIEVEGRLLAGGVERRRQVVYAANQTRKTIRDLSPSEVEMLLRLEPNRRFMIRPGESASFLLVFPDPPPDLTEVACRVVGARGA
jgi:predicted Zn finger-like uncharacterized protein